MIKAIPITQAQHDKDRLRRAEAFNNKFNLWSR